MAENKVISWGKSMYGGWYANIWKDGKYTGIHADTLAELKSMIKEVGIDKLERQNRSDN